MLKRLTERIWVFPFEEERDRPNLGYILGDRWSLAVDAGHSETHVRDFYRELEKAGLRRPSVTVLTHWHWDHTFGMHAVNGLTLASMKTNRCLMDFAARVKREGIETFYGLDERIRREYRGNTDVRITPSDMTYEVRMDLDAGNCPIRVLETASPHTDDSTLIEAPGEKVLFVGDATCGAFPSWEKEPALCRQLAETIRLTDAETCVEGHWTPVTKEAMIMDLLEDAGMEQEDRRAFFQ